MADISIPGVSDKYKTNDFIEALIKKERLPLTREQESLDRYKEQQNAWNGMSQKMTALRTNTKTLYSFDNPFNNKISTSTDENAITATPGREAAYGQIKIDVVKPATADRFLSEELDKDFSIPKGKYSFHVADKTISFNWKGGKVSEFVNSLNKHGSNTIKASIVGVSNNKQSLLLESLKTGDENTLIFKDDALSFALKHGIIAKTKADFQEIGTSLEDFYSPQDEFPVPAVEQSGMPEITSKEVEWDSEENRYILPPRSGLEIQLNGEILENPNNRIEFTYSTFETQDITDELNLIRTTRPELQEAGKVTYEDVTVFNDKTQVELPPVPPTLLTPITGETDFYARTADGKETQIKTASLAVDEETGEKTVQVDLKNYPDIQSIVIRNRNTGEAAAVSKFTVYDSKKDLGYEAVHPVSTAGDAIIKYEGITVNRPTNKIDDVIPHVTLNVFNSTEKTATIDIKPDKESAKDALIQFVGTYNQVLAEMNILSENKPEIISELDYLSSDEQENAQKRLGMFFGDSSLRSGKSSLQSIVSGSYRWSENATITMLNQLGISTRATGSSGGYSASQLRGYLEINEKQLDKALENDLDQIKNIFGYDSDGDLIVDTGIAYQLDRQLGSWVQSGGIIANKNATLKTRIQSSKTKIATLERQIDNKEAQLRSKYGQMEGTLNSLNAQSNTISNFANNGKQ